MNAMKIPGNRTQIPGISGGFYGTPEIYGPVSRIQSDL